MSTKADERVHQYFLLLQAGVPSATGNLDGASGNGSRRPRPPDWLVRHCEVGNALEALKKHQQDAVRRYWHATIMIEECERAVRVIETQKQGVYRTAAKKVGVNPRNNGTEWEQLRRDAQWAQREHEREVRRVGGWKAYLRGMEKITRALNGKRT